MSYTSLSQLVQHFESGGNYNAQSPTSTASGAYQFTNGTWRQYANQAGVDTVMYPTAASAPPAVQDQVFNQAVSSNGLNDWTCPGCDPGLTNLLQQNPQYASLPTFSGGGNTTNIAANGPFEPDVANVGPNAQSSGLFNMYDQNGNWVGQTSTQDPSMLPPGYTLQPAQSTATPAPQSTGGNTAPATSSVTGTGINVASNAAASGEASAPGYTPSLITGGVSSVGLTAGLAQGIGGWITGFENTATSWVTSIENSVGGAFKNALQGVFGTLQNFFTRAGLIVVGVVLLIVALFALAWDHGAKEIVVGSGAAATA